ncbi:MAG: putative dehydrogenase [Bacteroidetes bacterium]|nr:putative dehydrogenase [Bacteroidota bacterium]
MSTLGIGVIGVGHLGSLHAKLLRDVPGVKLSGVYDERRDHAAKVAAEMGTTAFPDLGALLAASDAVTIATPTSTHAAVAALAIEQGRHVMIEKPITANVEEAEALCAHARAKGVTVQVGHVERFNAAILALDKFELHPLFVESHRLAQFNPRGTDVAVVLDLMIHDIDLILSFVQSPVKHVDASGVAVVSDNVDIANARLQFENGCVANVTASRISQRKMRKMRLFQPSTYISIDFSQGLSEVFRLSSPDEPVEPGVMTLGEIGTGDRKRRVLYEQPEVREVNALQHELGLFAQAVRNGTRPVVSGEDGLRALQVADIIMDRIGEQRIVL